MPSLGRMLRRISFPIIRRLTSPKFAGLIEYGGTFAGAYLLRRGLFMPWELPEVLDPAFARAGWDELAALHQLGATMRGASSDAQKVSALELSWYMRNQLLRDSDWAGMANSVEIRVPYVDVPLFRTVASLMGNSPVDKRSVARVLDPPLPKELVNRRKTGFSVPVRRWLQGIDPTTAHQRGLRSWALRVDPQRGRGLRVLVLATDAFGSFGGIAKFNRDFLGSTCAHPNVTRVVCIPRLMPHPAEPMPAKLEYDVRGLNSKPRFIITVLRRALHDPIDVVVCGHLHLVPIGWLASVLARAPLVLIIHGIDAWQPSPSVIANSLVRRVDTIVAVSQVTLKRFLEWTGVDGSRARILPNSVDLMRFRPARKSQALIERYGLAQKCVIMTMGRLVSRERYKGFDQVLDLLPRITKVVPHVKYLIVGDGNDRQRLEQKVRELGMSDHVVFTGLIPEDEKVDHFNLADAYVMPSKGEGFGIVLLEAMACGVPVVASSVDGGREALRDGMLGTLVDPDDAEALYGAIVASLNRGAAVPAGLEYFSQEQFEDRVSTILDEIVRERGARSAPLGLQTTRVAGSARHEA
jgi:glycosyltransferase involved in cell wall biosynthesis